jgi:outer membrane protein TolC
VGAASTAGGRAAFAEERGKPAVTVRRAAHFARTRLTIAVLLTAALITQPLAGSSQPGSSQPAAEPAPPAQSRQRLQVLGPPVLDPAWGAWRPRPLVQTLLTLADAVELTLKHSPAIARARYDVALAAGRLQETRGVFDPAVTVVPGGAYLHEELTPSLRGFERNRRHQLDILATAFDSMYRGISDALNQAQRSEPFCPSALTFADRPGDFIIDRQDPLERRVLGVERDLRQELPIRIDQGIIRSSIGPIRLGSICRAPGDGGVAAGQTLDLAQRINQAGRYRLDAVIDGLRALPEEINRFRAELAETIAVRARLAFERLGAMPRDEVRKQIFLEASLSKPLRNGLTLRLDGRMESEERNFEDKPLDPAFGGFTSQQRFPSFGSATVDVPLLRGRGRVTAGAPERAAVLSLQAQRLLLRQRVAEEVFRVVLAYVNLVAAQESVQLLEQSASRQQDLSTLTQNLLAVGEVARSDLDRAEARRAAVGVSLSDRQLDLIAARASLVEVMGLDVVDLTRGPVAVESFAAPLPEPPGTASLMELARMQRLDPRALQGLEEASRVLAAAAVADLRYQLDLSITGGMSTFYESPFARYLPDEVNPIFSEIAPPATPPGRPVRYYSGRGFARSLTGEWNPFVRAMVTVNLPFANRAARGRAAQAGASLTRSQIERLDLDRRIRDTVSQVGGVVRALGGVIERRRAATDALQRSLDASIQQFEIGELTLLDTLVTEETLTTERLQLTADLQLYASAAARLAFETASLIQFDALGTPLEKIAFSALTIPVAPAPRTPPPDVPQPPAAQLPPPQPLPQAPREARAPRD